MTTILWKLHTVLIRTIDPNCHYSAGLRVNLAGVRTSADIPNWKPHMLVFLVSALEHYDANQTRIFDRA